MKRSYIAKLGKSDFSKTKRRIQSLLRQIAILRDKNCVLNRYSITGACSGPFQAEHLASRSISISYGDMRNIVLLCQRHHIFWKPQNSRMYWELIEQIIGPVRWNYIKLVEADKKPYKMDWLLVEVSLQHQLSSYEKN